MGVAVNVGIPEVEVLITLGGLKDKTDHDYFNPTSLQSRDCKLKTWGCEMGALTHASMFGTTASSLIQMPWNSWHSPCKRSHTIVTLLKVKEPYSTS